MTCCGDEFEGDSDNIKVLVLEAETVGLNQVNSGRSQQQDIHVGIKRYHKVISLPNLETNHDINQAAQIHWWCCIDCVLCCAAWEEIQIQLHQLCHPQPSKPQAPVLENLSVKGETRCKLSAGLQRSYKQAGCSNVCPSCSRKYSNYFNYLPWWEPRKAHNPSQPSHSPWNPLAQSQHNYSTLFL